MQLDKNANDSYLSQEIGIIQHSIKKKDGTIKHVAKLRNHLQDLCQRSAHDESKLTLYQQASLADIKIEKFLSSEISNTLKDFKTQSQVGKKSLQLAVTIL